MKIQEMRRKMIEIVENVGKGHLGTSLSSLEIILAIREVMRDGDIFISSKGHDALAQYMVLANEGILSWDDVESFRQPGGLPSHPTISTPGIAGNTGSLGMGLSKALGFALGHPERTVFVLLGDGEMMEGQNWEAALSIGKLGLDNIIAIVDCNDFSQDDRAFLTSARIGGMFHAAKWHSIRLFLDHDYIDKIEALNAMRQISMPVVIAMDTIKGKGASFEDTWQSHAGPPRDDYSVTHPTYRMFGRVVDDLMENDSRLILCGADTLRDHNCYQLKDKYTDRVFDFGIAEQNLVSFASARALDGQIPIVVTYAAFLRRAFEQIYNQTTEKTQVIYVGSMAGPLEEGGAGISHQSMDDGKYMGNLMPVTTVWPHQSYSLRLIISRAVLSGDTNYVRLLHHGDVYTDWAERSRDRWARAYRTYMG